MTPTEFYKINSKQRITEVCAAAGTTFGNFQQIAIAKGCVSSRLAKRLEAASNGEMSLNEILFPNESKAA